MYEDMLDWLKFLFGSDIRIKIFLCLEDGAKNLRNLRDEMGSSSSTILHAIRSMEEMDLVVKSGDGYALTNIGRIQVLSLVDVIRAFDALHTHKEFWLNHEMLDIPESMIKRIGSLSDSTVIRTTPTDLMKPITSFIKLLYDANKVKCVFPIFNQDFVGTVEKLVDGGVNFWLIITEEILDILLSDFRDRFKNTLYKENFKVWVIDEDIKEVFAVTDLALSLNLFLKNGVFDITSQLVSRSDEAILWGHELFEYYRKRAKTIGPEDI